MNESVFSPDEIEAAARLAYSAMSPCCLCGRACCARRLDGETGYCGARDRAVLSSAVVHNGEEPLICGPGGSGALFFSGCTIRCPFCQNYQISRSAASGRAASTRQLAMKMLELQEKGCSHLDLVSPAAHLPMILSALAMARRNGCVLPTVLNSNGYHPPETVDIMAAACEIGLFDLKFYSDGAAARWTSVPDYAEKARKAVERAAQVFGPLVIDEDGMARRGLIVRHLVLPGNLSETAEVLNFLANFPGVAVSLMSQYYPSGDDDLPAPLDRPLSAEEYYSAVEAAGRAGLDNIILQEPLSGSAFLPDFDRDGPFSSS